MPGTTERKHGTTKRNFVPRWVLVVAGWFLLSLVYSSHLYVYHTLRGNRTTWLEEFTEAVAYLSIWALLTPMILRLADRFPLPSPRWIRSLLLHVPSALLVSLFHVVFHAAIHFFLIHRNAGEEFNEIFIALFARTYHFGLLAYVLIVGLRRAFVFYRERLLQEAELRRQLVEAQLEALRMQLHPHFLFNTLHAISSLIQHNPGEADIVVARLSDLLRISLANHDSQEVTLREELEILNLYLEIEKTRFQDRLTVEISVDPALLDASVPTWILQPFVENSIRHGIARHRGSGKIVIQARSEDGSFQLSVRDNGKGLPENGGGIREGIGMANARKRLSRLYGRNARMEISNLSEGGMQVVLSLPLRRVE